MRVGSIPFSPFVVARFKSEDESPNPNSLWTDRWGQEIDELSVFMERLNFTAEFFNPEEMFVWGFVDQNGSWTGLQSMVESGLVDFAITVTWEFEWAQTVTSVTRLG